MADTREYARDSGAVQVEGSDADGPDGGGLGLA
jgi:hypothetical protein